MHYFLVRFLKLVGSSSHQKGIKPEFTWKRAETPVFKQSEFDREFTPTQTNRIIGGDTLGYRKKGSGVNAPVVCVAGGQWKSTHSVSHKLKYNH